MNKEHRNNMPVPGKTKKAKRIRERPNFLLKPVFQKTAKGGSRRQTSASARLSVSKAPKLFLIKR